MPSNDQAHLPGPPARRWWRGEPVWRPRAGAAPGSAALVFAVFGDRTIVFTHQGCYRIVRCRFGRIRPGRVRVVEMDTMTESPLRFSGQDTCPTGFDR